MWLHLTKQLSLEYLPFRHTCADVRLSVLSSQNSMNTEFLDTNLRRTLASDFFWDRAKPCMTASAISLSVELLFLPQRPFNISCTVPSTSNLSRILVILYPCWSWYIKLNPPTSLNFNNILHFPIPLQ